MKTVATLLAITLTLAGCADLDPIMGRTPGTPTTQPAVERPIDCDLIFPGGGADRR